MKSLKSLIIFSIVIIILINFSLTKRRRRNKDTEKEIVPKPSAMCEEDFCKSVCCVYKESSKNDISFIDLKECEKKSDFIIASDVLDKNSCDELKAKVDEELSNANKKQRRRRRI